MSEKKFYGSGFPNIDTKELKGKLIVLEGPDCSGRSTQITLLKEWLESKGHAVLNTGLKRSTLVGGVIHKAKQGNILGKKTLSLLYATDFADQLENKIIPALRAGYIVLSDRYIFTLMARDIIRGARKDWLIKLFDFAIVPDLIFHLNINSDILLHRTFEKYGELDYWESGMDTNLSSDMFESFKIYHHLLNVEYLEMSKEYDFKLIDASSDSTTIQNILRSITSQFLK